MAWISVIGTLAACCSVISFAPQALKVLRTRETKDISARMYVLTVTGFTLWTSYGLLLQKWPIIASNALCLMLSSFILVMKLLPRSKKEELAKTLTN